MGSRSLEQWCRDLLTKGIRDGLVGFARDEWEDAHPQAREGGELTGMANLLKQCLDDLRPPRAVCHWIYDDLDVWRTSCGQEFNLEDGSPTDNSIRFCPYCGNGVEWEISQEDSDGTD